MSIKVLENFSNFTYIINKFWNIYGHIFITRTGNIIKGVLEWGFTLPVKSLRKVLSLSN